jgi:hypothetical protein
MKKIISAIAHKINYLFKDIKVTQLLSIALVGFLILTTTVDPGLSKETATNKIDKMLQQDNDPNRPKTTAEWQQQARETKGKPGERLKRIGEQSADAVKEFGSMYPEVAKNSAKELKNNINDK